jgi:heat shock protein HtpX
MVWTFIKTTLLIGILTGILFAVAYLLGLSPIMALGFAAFMNLIIYWFSDSFVLKMGGAKRVTEEEAPRVYAALRRLTAASGTNMPKVALVNSPIPNAFATGRSPNNATVAVQLLSILNDDELEAVLAHELTHVRNWDTLTSTLAATVAGAISYLVQWGWLFGGAYGYGGSAGRDRQGNIIGLLLMVVLAPLAAMLVQLAVSRTREYSADEGGAKLSGKPQALASALQKIETYAKASRRPSQSQKNPAMAPLYIINPFRGSFVTELFSTHPATSKRIARLDKIAASMGYGPYYSQ